MRFGVGWNLWYDHVAFADWLEIVCIFSFHLAPTRCISFRPPIVMVSREHTLNETVIHHRCDRKRDAIPFVLVSLHCWCGLFKLLALGNCARTACSLIATWNGMFVWSTVDTDFTCWNVTFCIHKYSHFGAGMLICPLLIYIVSGQTRREREKKYIKK